MRKHSTTRAALAAGPLGAGYSGPETYRDLTLDETGDGALSLGIWSFDGTLVSDNPGSDHQAWLVISGTATIEQAAEVIEAGPGDLVVFEAPYGPKTVIASPEFRAVWIAARARQDT